MAEQIQLDTDVLEQLAQRYLEEQRRLKQAQAAVDRLKKELRAAVGNGNEITTPNYTLEVKEIGMRRMMKKEDFIRKHSPPVVDEHGNTILGPTGNPILDTDVGMKIYEEHLVESTSMRFHVKQKPL